MTTPPNTQYDPTVAYPQQPPMGAFPPPQGGYPSVPQQFKVPGIGPVIAFTAVFGIFGAISAARRSGKAKRAGFPTNKYWVTFGITVAVVWAVAGLIAAMGAGRSTTPPVTSAAVPATQVVADQAPAGGVELAADAFTAAWLQEDVVGNSDFKTVDGEVAEVAAATCSAVQVDTMGVGSYQCVIDFASGERQSQNINVDASGAWVTVA
ncbi:hypothetical protein [Actinoplanes xinjiangensis]|uniref:hypothetical protein n=1 Tax=Actinoplanes xinjiangensis TaxID=512350 RepID=UPI003419F785